MARNYAEDALALHKRGGRRIFAANTLLILARVAARERRFQQAIDYAQENVAILHQLGEQKKLNWRLIQLGRIALEASETEIAQTALTEALLWAQANQDEGMYSEARRLLAQLGLNPASLSPCFFPSVVVQE